MRTWNVLSLVDGVILECTLGTGDAEGDHIGIMLSIGAYDTLGLSIVDETDDVIFLKEGADDMLDLVKWCDIRIHT